MHDASASQRKETSSCGSVLVNAYSCITRFVLSSLHPDTIKMAGRALLLINYLHARLLESRVDTRRVTCIQINNRPSTAAGGTGRWTHIIISCGSYNQSSLGVYQSNEVFQNKNTVLQFVNAIVGSVYIRSFLVWFPNLRTKNEFYFLFFVFKFANEKRIPFSFSKLK